MADSCLDIEDITFQSQVFDLAFHPDPSRDVIASGQISGEVTIHSFSNEGNKQLMELNHHKKACRAVEFSLDGMYLMSASKDKSLQAVDMNTGAICRAIKKAHESPINCLKVLNQNFIATGDDDGNIKFWDTRTASAVVEFSENDDYISDMDCGKDDRILLAASGDGTLSVLNIRRKRFEARSENQENELLSLAKVKIFKFMEHANELMTSSTPKFKLKESPKMKNGGTKIVCGTSEGTLRIFTWNNWSDMSDLFPGHPMSVDACVALTDDIICTGSMDGIIRTVSILPNRFLGVVGEHGEFPVEQIRLSPGGNMLASCSHDQRIKFWDVSHFKQMSGNEDKVKTVHNNSSVDENFFEDL